MKRKVHIARIRPECLEAYKEYHRNIWPELEATYRRAGIRHISCYMKGLMLVIYAEYDTENPTFNEVDTELQERWQVLMRPMADPTWKEGGDCEEIYNMSSVGRGDTEFHGEGIPRQARDRRRTTENT